MLILWSDLGFPYQPRFQPHSLGARRFSKFAKTPGLLVLMYISNEGLLRLFSENPYSVMLRVRINIITTRYRDNPNFWCHHVPQVFPPFSGFARPTLWKLNNRAWKKKLKLGHVPVGLDLPYPSNLVYPFMWVTHCHIVSSIWMHAPPIATFSTW